MCHLAIIALCLSLALPHLVPAAPGAPDLQSLSGSTLIQQAWADGDSFQVKLPDGKEITLRLYGADCMEIHMDGDDSNARRLRDQRRYFGIADIQKAKAHGERAKAFVETTLAKPFTVHTAFADGRGDGRFQRFYGFVTTADGKDLATLLVAGGLARAFGVTRATPEGISGKEYMNRLHDQELAAAKLGRGAWNDTNWQHLPEDRRQAREEEEELNTAKGRQEIIQPINPNTAARDELMRLPNVGEKLANRIIEARAAKPFTKADDLGTVSGVGPATLEKMKPYLKFRD